MPSLLCLEIISNRWLSQWSFVVLCKSKPVNTRVCLTCTCDADRVVRHSYRFRCPYRLKRKVHVTMKFTQFKKGNLCNGGQIGKEPIRAHFQSSLIYFFYVGSSIIIWIIPMIYSLYLFPLSSYRTSEKNNNNVLLDVGQ